MGKVSEERIVLDALFARLDAKPEGERVFTASTMSDVKKGLGISVRTRTVEAILRKVNGKEIRMTLEPGSISISRA